MSLKTKMTKAKKLGIEFAEGYTPKSEEELDKMIEAKNEILGQQKEEAKIATDNAKKAAEEAKHSVVILQDIDGDDVDQEEYFWPRFVEETITDGAGTKTVLKPTKETAPAYFNRICGFPVDREELKEVFLQYFPRAKGFLFYKARDREVFFIIVPLKYATTISRSNESRPGDHQRHALSFIAEGSVNVESLKLKLARIAKHSSISTEPLARS